MLVFSVDESFIFRKHSVETSIYPVLLVGARRTRETNRLQRGKQTQRTIAKVLIPKRKEMKLPMQQRSRKSIIQPLVRDDREKDIGHDEENKNPTDGSKSLDPVGKGNDKRAFLTRLNCMSSTRMTVLLVLCLQNSLFTVLRRYSQGVLKEKYSKYEVLLVGEIIKMAFSAWMIRGSLSDENGDTGSKFSKHIMYVIGHSQKMLVLAFIYGAMNILSFVSLRNIGAGTFTIFAQCKILTTALCSAIILKRTYSWTKWRALIALMFGVLLFSEHIWGDSANLLSNTEGANAFVGVLAVVIEVTLSGFASIYFEKVIKTDAKTMTIWERNFQLALGSFPVYFIFIASESNSIGSGWSFMAFIIALLGAAGGLLVALSIKYGDSILKTLATTGAIVLSSLLDHYFLGGPLTPTMMIAGIQVIISICNYTFDMTPSDISIVPDPPKTLRKEKLKDDVEVALAVSASTPQKT